MLFDLYADSFDCVNMAFEFVCGFIYLAKRTLSYKLFVNENIAEFVIFETEYIWLLWMLY